MAAKFEILSLYSSVKFNDRFEFPETLDLSEFIKYRNEDSAGAAADVPEAMEVDNVIGEWYSVLPDIIIFKSPLV